MTYLTRAVFAGASLLLLLSAMALIGFGVSDAIDSIRSPDQSGADAVLDVLGGEAFATRRHVWWNFVSSSRDRIAQAREDWNAHRFPIVPGDDAERIEIPAVPKTVSYP